MKKVPSKKHKLRKTKPRTNIDPTRLAIAALERIKTVLTKSGHADKLGEPVSMKDLVAQTSLLGATRQLPPSYVAAMRVASRFGDADRMLTAAEMATKAREIAATVGRDGDRYLPFCESGESFVCFDKGRLHMPEPKDGELPVVELVDGAVRALAHNFGEWLDGVADAREESVENAARIPQRLMRLLNELGFRFEYPVVGRLETGDTEAISELIGPKLVKEVKAGVDRLFDSGGKASLTLNLDEFTLAASLRTGIFVFEAEDVFRWLRHFRDENFFGDTAGEPSHADSVRDLRRAPREAPLIQRGVLELASLPATKYVFRAASGTSANDFYLLGRTQSKSEHAPSLILHVVDGAVATAHALDEPLKDLYVTPSAEMWGLSQTHAVRFSGGKARTFPLSRGSSGRTWWYGIGGGTDRILVWGSGALLAFDGDNFQPFTPNAGLDPAESIVSLCANGPKITMLVCGDRMGAVAQFDGARWQEIDESGVMEGLLVDMDMWRSAAFVLGQDGSVWRIDGGPPRTVRWDYKQQAFLADNGAQRATHSVRSYETGVLVASDGGVIDVGGHDPVFYAAKGARDPAKLSRVGGLRVAQPRGSVAPLPEEPGIVAMCGGHVWIWKSGAFHVLDMHEW